MSGLEQHVRQTQQVRQTISLALLKSTILRTEMWNAGVTREGLRQKTARTEGHLAAVVIVDGVVCPPPPHIQICSSPKPWSCERDLIWKYCLQRCNQVNMRSYWIRMDPEPWTDVFKTRNIWTETQKGRRPCEEITGSHAATRQGEGHGPQAPSSSSERHGQSVTGASRRSGPCR